MPDKTNPQAVVSFENAYLMLDVDNALSIRDLLNYVAGTFPGRMLDEVALTRANSDTIVIRPIASVLPLQHCAIHKETP